MSYQPKRSSSRWLEGAPSEVLACYDHSTYSDRYTVLLGGKNFWTPDMGRTVQFLGLSEAGNFYWETMNANNRASCGKKIAWKDLPEIVRHVVTSQIALTLEQEEEPVDQQGMNP